MATGTKRTNTTKRTKAAKRVRVALRVGTTEFDGVGVSDLLPARIEGIGFESLRAGGMMTAVRGEYAVELIVAPLGTEGDSYVSTVAVYRGDEELPGSRRRIKCELCLEDELLSQIRDELDGVVKAIREDRAPPVAKDLAPIEVAPERKSAPVSVYVPPVRTAEPTAGMGPLGGAGVGALFVGALGFVAGTALLVTDEHRIRDDRRPGTALVGVGGAVMITGIALMVVDREQRRSRSAVVPALSRSSAGIAWVGHF